jgi:hypothetical protein
MSDGCLTFTYWYLTAQMRWCIKTDGRRVLQQMSMDDHGNTEWDDVPEEKEGDGSERGV